MPAADKCHLLIPFKEWAKDLSDALDGVEGVNQSILRRMGDQDFENYKAIERRVNDPSCGSCGCVMGRWYMDQVTLVADVSDNSVFLLTEDTATGIGFASTGTGTQAIEAPSAGAYHIVLRAYTVLGDLDPTTAVMSAEVFNFGDGADGDLISDYIALYPNSNETYGYFKSATIAHLDAGATITPYTRINSFTPVATGDEFKVGGTGIGDSQISVTKICGC